MNGRRNQRSTPQAWTKVYVSLAIATSGALVACNSPNGGTSDAQTDPPATHGESGPTASPSPMAEPSPTESPSPVPTAEPSQSPSPQPSATPSSTPSPVATRVHYSLPYAESVRNLSNNVLELSAKLPIGAVISVMSDAVPGNYNYRDANGNVLWSSNFYYPTVRIESVPQSSQAQFPASKIAQLNATAGGLYVVGTLLDAVAGDTIPALKPGAAGAGFLAYYAASGKPKVNYTSYFKTRFPGRLNLTVTNSQMSAEESDKWEKIYQQLKLLGDRTQPTVSELLFVPSSLASEYSLLFEQKGIVQELGAWTIAVQGTAVRHGFSNVPCAEFQSELVRHAYKRAGYDFLDDFSASKGNALIWSSTAAVVNLANALFKAGWIPWEAVTYKPKLGAIAMNEKATSPGHTYMIAGDDGRFVVDNGSPKGRDLRTTSASIIDMMYHTGVFFLPPGILPERWSDSN